MVTRSAPLLIKHYASRRLYNTETSDYVTLDDIAGFIREGREVILCIGDRVSGLKIGVAATMFTLWRVGRRPRGIRGIRILAHNL